MNEINVLKLLDEMDKFRRDHQNSKEAPADWCMRVLEAIVAKHAGYGSRNEWTEKLMGDENTMYHHDCSY